MSLLANFLNGMAFGAGVCTAVTLICYAFVRYSATDTEA